MARRGSRRKKSRGGRGKKVSGFLKKIPIINNPTFQRAAAGVGTVTLAAGILNLVGAGRFVQSPLVRAGLSFAGGGLEGVVAQFVLGGGGLSNILGGGGMNGGESGAA